MAVDVLLQQGEKKCLMERKEGEMRCVGICFDGSLMALFPLNSVSIYYEFSHCTLGHNEGRLPLLSHLKKNKNLTCRHSSLVTR